ncbi:hypothetical protein, partial [Escherichia coli]|uniref:hypothetical protein n=1 Tax=Escherichia coli TaxID=562 RepID=UPI00253FBC23
EIDQIKAELKSIKRLLLNKCHFPPAPTFSSIPQWQLIKTNKQQVEQSSDNANGIQVPSLPQQKEDDDGTLNLSQQKEDNGTETLPNLP